MRSCRQTLRDNEPQQNHPATGAAAGLGFSLMIFLFLALGVASCPFALSGLWTSRWFRIGWNLMMAMLIAGFFNSRH
jgi:hypothetical protein